MERFLADDQTAFDALFTRHAGRVRSYLRRFVGPSVADDLTQSTFLSIVRARGRFTRGARFKPWLYAIATNAARDHLRRHRHEEVVAPGDLPDTPAEPVAPRDAGLERTVRTAVDALPASQREAILLHRFHGFSFLEIAETLGVSETAVKVRAHRGYERLRVLLGGLKGDAS